MSMVVKNNMSAVRTLSTLNRNSSALQKSLAKVSSGMKINSAQDDASGYAISERMRVQIRSLDQANQNTQNASSLIKTAEGAVSSTLDLVRTMKEKAVNAATDTNTDADRLTIQKELDQFIDQVDDNALVTFNGKILLDGNTMPYHKQEYTKEQNIIRGLNSSWISDALYLIKESYGIDFASGEGGKAGAKHLDVKFYEDDTSTTIANCGSSYGGETVTLNINIGAIRELESQGQAGQDGKFKIAVKTPVLDDSGNPTEEMTDTFVYNAQTLDRVIAHELTHGVMINRFKNFNELPSWIVEGGSAELVHGADSRIAASDSYLASAGAFKAAVFDLPPGATGAEAQHAYDGGFIAMRFMMAVGNVNASDGIKKFMEVMDRGGTLNEAVHSGSGGIWGSTDTFVNSFVGELDSYVGKGVENGTYADTTEAATAFLKEKCGIDLENDDTGSITGSDAGGKLTKTGSSVVHEIGSPVNWRMPSSNSTMIGGIEVRWPAGMSVANENGGNMVFHIGAKANDAFNVGFNDMRARSIGLYDEAGEKLNVTTQARAKAAIHTLDKIVDLVVDQQANIGAMLQRLDYTASNLTVSSENVQAAESTIRDADMAKEMTNYTKNNVLLQASQSMLAQANQNSSAVLSLLQ